MPRQLCKTCLLLIITETVHVYQLPLVADTETDINVDDDDDDVTVTSLLAGNGLGGVLRHGVHRSAVVSRLSKQVHVLTRPTSLRPETYFSNRSATSHWLRHFRCNYEAAVNAARFRTCSDWSLRRPQ